MKAQSRKFERGSAMLVAMGSLVMMLVLGVAVMMYANRASATNTRRSREGSRFHCAESGLQLARAFYGYNWARWNEFISTTNSNDKIHNALMASNWPNPAVNLDPFSTKSGSLREKNPELFADLDGDGKADVYLFIRDNTDEVGTQNWNLDTDGRVYVGALCVSQTMSQKSLGYLDTQNVEVAEALVTPAIRGIPCTQAGCGNGANNLNIASN